MVVHSVHKRWEIVTMVAVWNFVSEVRNRSEEK